MKITALIAATLIVLSCGIFSDIHLGDEVVHYRLARTIYQTRQWPLYDAMNQSYGTMRFYFVDPMLWHTMLAGMWKLTGGVSKVIAQLFQAFFFFLLIASTYIVARRIYGRESALACAFILASIPVIPALSIILHTDVPVVAMVMSSLALLSKKQYVPAGIVAACTVLMKRTAYLSLPAVVMFAFLEPVGTRSDRLGSRLRFFAPFMLIVSVGLLQVFMADSIIASTLRTTDMLYHFSGILRLPLKDMFDMRENVLLVFLFSGIILLFCLVMYALRRGYSRKDIPVVCSAASIVVLAYARFGASLSARYLIVVLPFVAMLAGAGFCAVRSPRLKRILAAIGICQFLAAALFTAGERTLLPGTKEFYEYLRLNTPAEARIMCSRPDPQLYADRMTIWNNYLSIKEMPYLFWLADNEAALTIFDKYAIDYLLVEKDRIYDDTAEKHQLGWPLSFIVRIGEFRCLRHILENDRFALYKVVR